MFGTIASRYDLVNHIISFNTDRMWRRKAAAMIAAGHPLKILDVACGTADLTIEMHRQMPRAEITGIDISEEMLQLGRSKTESLQENKELRRHEPDVPKEIDYKSVDKPLSANSNRKFSKITLKQGNAEKIESPGETYDAVCIAFGIRNVSERYKALREFNRVLKDNGKLMVLEFSMPEKGLFSLLYKLYFNYVLPVTGGLVSGNFKAYKYFIRSVKEFPSPEKFTAMLSECGFSVEQVKPLTGGAAWIYMAVKSDK